MVSNIWIDNIWLHKHPVFLDLKWENIPKLSIISGINGSGKTQLLESIKNNFAMTIRNQIAEPIPYLNEIQYVPSNHVFASLDASSGNIAGVESRKTGVLHYIKTFNQQGNFSQQMNRTINDLIVEIENNAEKTVKLMTDEEILNSLSFDYLTLFENAFNNQYIAEMFKSYEQEEIKLKLEQYKKKNIITDEQIVNKLGRPPWQIINELFDKYGFHYNIAEPIFDIAYALSFKEKNSIHSINFSLLSTGEKLIVNLVLWAYSKNLAYYNKIFLLDEFDAHLNPSLCKMFVDIIRNIIVDEFGIQVMMTTHSPSTVAHAKDEELFWMERHNGIKKSSKVEIIPILSDGIISINEDTVSLLIDYSINVISEEKPILLVEGITDKIILEKAWDILYPNEKIPFYIQDVFDCYYIVNTFLRGDIFNNYPNRHFIGLLDFDSAYDNWKEKSTRNNYKEKILKSYEGFNSTSYIHDKYKSNILMLPIPQHRINYAGRNIKGSSLSIELLFDDIVIQQYCEKNQHVGGVELYKFKDSKKTDFARQVQTFNNTGYFVSFKPIFEAIKEVIQQNEVKTARI